MTVSRRKQQSGRKRSNRIGGSLSRVLKGIYNGIGSFFKSSFITAAPLMIYLFLGATYWLALTQMLSDPESYPMFWRSGLLENPSEKLAAELFKQKIYIGSYALSLVIIMFNLRAFITFFWRERTLLIAVCILLVTSFVSDNPDRVFIGVMHLSFGIIAVWMYLNHEKRKQDLLKYCCMGVAIPILTNLTLSMVLYLIREPNFLDTLLGDSRYSGLSGNPNTLGATCAIGAWAIFTLMTRASLGSKTMFICILAVLVVLFNLATTGSATAQSIVGFVGVMLILHRISSAFNKKVKAALLVLMVAAFFGFAFSLVIQQNVDEYAANATESVGKDLTLTGRTDLWLIALDAISQRPILGYSYDNHETVMSNPIYATQFNHFHNGYLDSLLVGGVVFGLAIVLCYLMLVKRYFAVSSPGDSMFPLLLAVATASIHNFSEYSMFRSNTPIWSLFIIALIALTLSVQSNTSSTKPSKRVSRRNGRNSKSGSNTSSVQRYRW